MSEQEMFKIKTGIDTGAIEELPQAVNDALQESQKLVSDFNKTAEIAPKMGDMKELKKELGEIDKELKNLSKERDIQISLADSKKTREEIEKIDKKISELTKTKELKLELNKRATNDFKKGLGELAVSAAKFTAAFAAVGVGLLAVGVQSAQAMDRIDKSSQKLGLSVRSFQELDYIAKQTGTSVDGLSRTMKTLSTQAAENESEFKKIGVSVRDTNGSFKSQEQIFKETITALQGYKEGVERSNMATKLLGMGAQELAPLLNSGAGSIDNMAQRAEKLGLILDEKTIKQGVKFNDALTDLKSAGTALLQTVLIPMLPKLTELANSIAEAAKNIAPLAETWLPRIGKAIALVATVLGTYIIASKAATLTTLGLVGAIKASTVALLANPVGLVAAALAGLVLVIIEVTKNFDYWSAQAVYAFAVVKSAALNFFSYFTQTHQLAGKELIKAVLSLAKFILDTFVESQTKVLELLSMLPGKLGSPFKSALDIVNGLRDGVLASIDSLAKGFDDNYEKQKDTWSKERAINNQKISDAQRVRDEKLALLKKETQDNKAELERQATGTKQITEISESKRKMMILEATYALDKDIATSTISNKKDLSQTLLALERDFLNQKLALVKEQAQKEIESTGTVTEQTRQGIKALSEEIRRFEESHNDSLNENVQKFNQTLGYIRDMVSSFSDFTKQRTENEISNMEAILKADQAAIDSRLAMQQAYYDAQLEKHKDLEQRKEDVSKEYTERLAAIEEEKQSIMSMAQFEALEERRLATQTEWEIRQKALNAEEEEKQRLEAERLLAEENALKEKERLEKEHAIKVAQLRRKQAQYDKASSIAQTLISIAQGIAAQMTVPFPLGQIFAGLVAAAGAIQLATVMRTPLPEIPSFSEGGLVPGANAGKGYNVPPAKDPKDKTLVWATEGERILSLKETALYDKLLAQGWSMQQALAQVHPGGQISTNDNSNHITANVKITAREVPSWAESRRETEHTLRKVARGLRTA